MKTKRMMLLISLGIAVVVLTAIVLLLIGSDTRDKVQPSNTRLVLREEKCWIVK